MQNLSSQWYQGYSNSALLLRLAMIQGGSVCFLGAGVMAMCVFGWLYFPRQTGFMTALPARREAVFLSHALAGFTLLEAGNVVTVLLCAMLGQFAGVEPGVVLEFFAIVTLLIVFFFGFACFCATLTGNIVILPAVYAVLLYAAVALEASLRRIVQFLMFGLTGQRWKLTILSPAYYLRLNASRMVDTEWVTSPRRGGTMALIQFRGWPVIIGYACVGVMFAALAVALLRRRSMETAGDVVAVPALRGAFRWCAALAGALSMGLLSLQMVFGYTGLYSVTGSFPDVLLLLFLMLVGAFLGWFGARGLLHKSLRVFDRGWGGFAVVCALVCALVLGCELDLTGAEKKLPDPRQVARVELFSTFVGGLPTELTEPENIAAALEMHKTIIDNKSLYEADGKGYADGGTLDIRYYDEEGTLLEARAYGAPYGPMAWASAGNAWITAGNAESVEWVACGSGNPALPALEALFNAPEVVAARVSTHTVPATAATAEQSFAYWMKDYVVRDSLDLEPAEAWELYRDCILPDTKDSSLGRIRLCPSDTPEDDPILVNVGIVFLSRNLDDYNYESISLCVPADAVRTNDWLLSHGMEIPGRNRTAPFVSEEPEGTVNARPAAGEDDGLSLLLEKVCEEYEPAAAGTVVSVRWARMLLDWYSSMGEDPVAARVQAERFAGSRVLTGDRWTESLEKLRTAGLQLASGELGLVRDGNGHSWSADTVNELFDALESALL